MDTQSKLLFDKHGGVCGCPEFWSSREESHRHSPNLHHPEPVAQALLQDLRPHWLVPQASYIATSPSPLSHSMSRDSATPIPITPVTPTDHHHHHPHHSTSKLTAAPDSCMWKQPFPRDLNLQNRTSSAKPKETCFFWYHGNCRRTTCGFEHETHVTWPVSVPKGFVHWDPCLLPLCPLRVDLAKAWEGVVGEGYGYEGVGGAGEGGGAEMDLVREVEELIEGIRKEGEVNGDGNDKDNSTDKDNNDGNDNSKDNGNGDGWIGLGCGDGVEDGEITPEPQDETPSESQTCFFWYHGDCIRGARCQWVHENDSTTLPVLPPPRYDGSRHLQCRLPRCPYREGEGDTAYGNMNSVDTLDKEAEVINESDEVNGLKHGKSNQISRKNDHQDNEQTSQSECSRSSVTLSSYHTAAEQQAEVTSTASEPEYFEAEETPSLNHILTDEQMDVEEHEPQPDKSEESLTSISHTETKMGGKRRGKHKVDNATFTATLRAPRLKLSLPLRKHHAPTITTPPASSTPIKINMAPRKTNLHMSIDPLLKDAPTGPRADREKGKGRGARRYSQRDLEELRPAKQQNRAALPDGPLQSQQETQHYRPSYAVKSSPSLRTARPPPSSPIQQNPPDNAVNPTKADVQHARFSESQRERAAAPICFQYYHTGQCGKYHDRNNCPYQHKGSSNARLDEYVELPRTLAIEGHNDCTLSLCPVRLLGVRDMVQKSEREWKNQTLKRKAEALKEKEERIREEARKKAKREVGGPVGNSVDQKAPLVEKERAVEHKIGSAVTKEDVDKLAELLTSKPDVDVPAGTVADQKASKAENENAKEHEIVPAVTKDDVDKFVESTKADRDVAGLYQNTANRNAPEPKKEIAKEEKIVSGASQEIADNFVEQKIESKEEEGKTAKVNIASYENFFGSSPVPWAVRRQGPAEEPPMRKLLNADAIPSTPASNTPRLSSSTPPSSISSVSSFEVIGTDNIASMKTLVDYQLPEGAKRAAWDTDFLRLAFGEVVMVAH